MRTSEPSSIDVQILQEAVAPDAPTLSIPVARALAALCFNPDQEEAICRLLDKNNAGTISNRDREVLKGHVRVGNFLSLLKAKARSTLSARTAKR